MANFNNYINTLLAHEGGYSDHPNDRGGATNKGITLSTWKKYGYDKDGDKVITKEDVKLITDADAAKIYKQRYWDVIWGDRIPQQQIANIVFDTAVNSGSSRAIKILQELLNRLYNKRLKVDGIMGKNTFSALTSKINSSVLYGQYINMRKDYYNFLAGKYRGANANFFTNVLRVRPNSSQQVFLKGWLNRLSSFSTAQKIGFGVGALLITSIALYFLTKKIRK